MTYIRVTKIFTFEMAHLLHNYDGLCKNIHGHSYSLYVTIGGIPLKKENDPKDGMVMDFSELKRIVNEKIIQSFDHSLVINQLTPEGHIDNLRKFSNRIIPVSFQPTCENLTILFADILRKEIPEPAKLLRVKLYETATSYSEWIYEDAPFSLKRRVGQKSKF